MGVWLANASRRLGKVTKYGPVTKCQHRAEHDGDITLPFHADRLSNICVGRIVEKVLDNERDGELDSDFSPHLT